MHAAMLGHSSPIAIPKPYPRVANTPGAPATAGTYRKSIESGLRFSGRHSTRMSKSAAFT
jgi:hypothetical protein